MIPIILMGLKLKTIITTVSSIVRNLKSAKGGHGKINTGMIFKDGMLDLFKVAVVVLVLLAAFGVIDKETVEWAVGIFEM